MSERAVICNVGEQEWTLVRTYGMYRIPAAEAGEELATLEVADRIDVIDMGDNRRLEVPIHARKIAEDLAADLGDYGVFVAANGEPTAEEIACAREHLVEVAKKLVFEGDQEWARNHNYRLLSDLHRRAAPGGRRRARRRLPLVSVDGRCRRSWSVYLSAHFPSEPQAGAAEETCEGERFKISTQRARGRGELGEGTGRVSCRKEKRFSELWWTGCLRRRAHGQRGAGRCTGAPLVEPADRGGPETAALTRSERLQFLAGLEADSFARGNADLFSGARVAANAGFAAFDVEDTEAAQLDPIALSQGTFHRLENRFHRHFGFATGDSVAEAFHDSVYEVQLDHPASKQRRMLDIGAGTCQALMPE